jgi:hypothetical protein
MLDKSNLEMYNQLNLNFCQIHYLIALDKLYDLQPSVQPSNAPVHHHQLHSVMHKLLPSC